MEIIFVPQVFLARIEAPSAAQLDPGRRRLVSNPLRARMRGRWDIRPSIQRPPAIAGSRTSFAHLPRKPVLNRNCEHMLKQLGLLAVAGALGTLCRYGMSGFLQRVCGVGFPWGTMAVNLLGCLLFGFIWTLAEERLIISGQTRFIVLTGFMGAFTTFSTFAFESDALLRDSEWLLAAGNILGQNVLGMLCVFLGFFIGRLF